MTETTVEKKDVDQVEKTDENTLTDEIITKYQTAADIANKALTSVVAASVEGASILDLCKLGDSAITEGVKAVYAKKKDMMKGISYPTCVSTGNIICHLSPSSQDADRIPALANGDTVRIELGSHIDGYIATAATTIVVGAKKAEAPITGKKADVIQATYLATEAALRLMKPGKSSYEVTEAVQKIAQEFGCVPVQGMISHQLQRNVIDGSNQIVLNPSPDQKKNTTEFSFEEGQVFSLDLVLSTGEGIPKALETHRTSVFKRDPTVTFGLKTDSGRKTFAHLKKEIGDFPFSVRQFPDETKARAGLSECSRQGLVSPYHVLYEKEGAEVAHLVMTVLLTPTGPLKITGLPWDQELVKSEKVLNDEGIKELLKQPIRSNSKAAKKKKKKAAEDSAAAEPVKV